MAERLFLWNPPEGFADLKEPQRVQLSEEVLKEIWRCQKHNKAKRVNKFILCTEWILTQSHRHGRVRLFKDKELDKIDKILTAVGKLITRIENVEDDAFRYLDSVDLLPLLKNYQRWVTRIAYPTNLPGLKRVQRKNRKAVLAIYALTNIYRNELEEEPSPADESRFHRIVASLMPELKQETKDPRHLIRLALKLRPF